MKMANLIIGFILIVIGYLTLLNTFGEQTKHYVVKISINGVDKILTFSVTPGEVLTSDFIKRKFDYLSKDKLIILDIKSISRDEKKENWQIGNKIGTLNIPIEIIKEANREYTTQKHYKYLITVGNRNQYKP